MRIQGTPYPVPAVPPAASRASAPRIEAPAPETAAGRKGLLELLTPEERAFFERQALGPLTYRPGRTTPDPAPAPIGQRIDVKG